MCNGISQLMRTNGLKVFKNCCCKCTINLISFILQDTRLKEIAFFYHFLRKRRDRKKIKGSEILYKQSEWKLSVLMIGMKVEFNKGNFIFYSWKFVYIIGIILNTLQVQQKVRSYLEKIHFIYISLIYMHTYTFLYIFQVFSISLLIYSFLLYKFR